MSIRCLIAAALFTVQFMPPPGAVTGLVIKSGTAILQPLPNARLELSGGQGGVMITRTDAGGRFAFLNLAAGVYRLSITCDGFIRQEYPKPLTIERGQPLSEIRFDMEPAPTATGWVLDSFGLPIPNVTIDALRRTYDVRGNPRFARVATGLTDDRGEYRIFWLDPGDYFFYATSTLSDDPSAPPLSAVSPTYFPGVNVPEAATPVRLDIGREVRVDFRLRGAGLWIVRGQTLGTIGRSVAANVTLTAPAEDPGFSRFTAQTAPTGPLAGEFSIQNVPPGSYILMARSGSGDQQINMEQRIVLAPVPQTPPPYSVSLLLTPPSTITGRLYADSHDVSDLRGARLELISVDPDLPSPKPAAALPNGQFSLKAVPLGSYVVEISNLPGDVYLKAARFGDADILDKPLTLGIKDAAQPLQILLASDGGRLEVSTYGADGALHADAKVVLVPDGARREHREWYRVSTSGEDGHAAFRGIPPGTYKIFAWDNAEPNAYLNADYLHPFEGLGVPVNITSGDNPPASVQIILKD